MFSKMNQKRRIEKRNTTDCGWESSVSAGTTHSVSSTLRDDLRCSITALMRRRASDSVSVGTFWNSPSFSSVVASSSPAAVRSRGRDSGAISRLNLKRDLGATLIGYIDFRRQRYRGIGLQGNDLLDVGESSKSKARKSLRTDRIVARARAI